MSQVRIDQLRLLAKVLFAAAAAVLVLSIIGAIRVATSSSNVLFYSDIQHENRGVIALAAFGGGVFAAAVIAALAAILTVMVDREQTARDADGQPPPAQGPRQGGEEAKS